MQRLLTMAADCSPWLHGGPIANNRSLILVPALVQRGTDICLLRPSRKVGGHKLPQEVPKSGQFPTTLSGSSSASFANFPLGTCQDSQETRDQLSDVGTSERERERESAREGERDRTQSLARERLFLFAAFGFLQIRPNLLAGCSTALSV